jgi:uncharacterized cupredoxin-like copper-binding protein
MIRFFVLTGILGGAVVAYLTTFGVGPISQLPPPVSLLTDFRAEGKLPENQSLAIDETAEDLEVFQVPDQDIANLEVAKAAYEEMISGMDMKGMDMKGMDMSGSGSGGDTMNMAGNDDGSNMNMAEDDNGSDMNMNGDDNGSDMNMGDGDGSNMNMADNADGNQLALDEPDGGLAFFEGGNFDREVVLTMAEWKFSEMSIDVKMGERIKFTVKNGGQIPHEFMFMSPPLMNAVTYRATRADWSLYEHEALFEQALVLPGGEFTFVLQVTEPGSWMFMCMLPYHMQMGMMGQMATEGMEMDM